MTAYMLENNYLNVSVQKGGIPGFAGCLEHTSVLPQLITEARDNKGGMSVVWLDLTNAYGSIPHKLVAETLNRYHVPNEIQNMLAQYSERFYIRFNVGERTTNWQRLEKGIITGCTISVIIFTSAVNLIAKSAEKECKGPLMRSGIRQPPVKAFMDDLTGITMNTERKWDVSEAVSQAKSKLEHKEIVGMVCVGKQGIGYSGSQQWWSKAKKKDKRDMLVQEIRNTEEEQRHTKTVSM